MGGQKMREYQISSEVQRSLDELDRRYIRLQIKSAIDHGLIIGLIIYIGLRIWGIV